MKRDPALKTAKHWYDKADEARAIADNMLDPVAKKTMLGIAKSYERMAERNAQLDELPTDPRSPRQ